MIRAMSDNNDPIVIVDSPSDALATIAARRAARRAAAGAEDDDARELENARAIDQAEEVQGTIVGKGLRVLQAPDGSVVIVKKPANATYRKFQDSKDKPEDASKAFVKPCVVHPSKDAYDTLLTEYPGMLVRLVRACAELAGYAAEEK